MFYHNIRPQLYIVFSQCQMNKDFVRLEYGSHVILVLIVQFCICLVTYSGMPDYFRGRGGDI